MKLRHTNQLNMIGACIAVANKEEYQPVWKNQPPLDFGTDFDALQSAYTAVQSEAGVAEKVVGGAMDVKTAAETVLEDAGYSLARALAVHFKKTGDLDKAAKVHITEHGLKRLKAQLLIGKCMEIHDLAVTAQTHPDAAKRGITAENIKEVADAIAAFRTVMNAPRGQIIGHGMLRHEIERDVAALLEQLVDLDGLILQYRGTELGQRFVNEWQQARIIVDVGHRFKPDAPTPAPAPAAATA